MKRKKAKIQLINPGTWVIVCNNKPDFGDQCISVRYPGKLLIFGRFENSYPDECRKVLVVPDQLPSDVVLALIDGRLKNGDAVEVEMKAEEDSIGMSWAVPEEPRWVVSLKDGAAVVYF